MYCPICLNWEQWVPFLLSAYTHGSWGSEELNKQPRDTQLEGGEGKIQTQQIDPGPWAPETLPVSVARLVSLQSLGPLCNYAHIQHRAWHRADPLQIFAK